jgi:hypothetical protein
MHEHLRIQSEAVMFRAVLRTALVAQRAHALRLPLTSLLTIKKRFLADTPSGTRITVLGLGA